MVGIMLVSLVGYMHILFKTSLNTTSSFSVEHQQYNCAYVVVLSLQLHVQYLLINFYLIYAHHFSYQPNLLKLPLSIISFGFINQTCGYNYFSY